MRYNAKEKNKFNREEEEYFLTDFFKLSKMYDKNTIKFYNFMI